MRRKHLNSYFSLVLAIILSAILGCSTAKSIAEKMSPKAVAQKILPTKSGLKKRLLVLPLVDEAHLGPERAAEATASFIQLLNKSSHLLVYEAPKNLSMSKGETQQSKFGIMIDPEMIKKAMDLDMNAAISGSINPIETSTKKTGFWTWPFRKAIKAYSVSVDINVVDVQCGTIYLINHESVEVPFREDEMKDRRKEQIIDRVLKEAMPRILKRQAEAVNEELAKEPWSGRILSIEDNTIMINAGSEVGVEPGHEFTVFAHGEKIVCKTGKSIEILGKKVGVIKTTSVMEKHSLALPVTEGTFLEGQIIRDR
jgi:hypothetical protein